MQTMFIHTDEPRDGERPYNLWEPVAGDFGAHGEFDARAQDRSRSWYLEANKHFRSLALAGVALLSAAALLARHSE